MNTLDFFLKNNTAREVKDMAYFKNCDHKLLGCPRNLLHNIEKINGYNKCFDHLGIVDRYFV